MVQNVSQLFYLASSILLKGYSSAIQNVASILRNFVAIRKIESSITLSGVYRYENLEEDVSVLYDIALTVEEVPDDQKIA